MAGTSLQLTYAEIRENIAMMISVNRDPTQWTGTEITNDVSRILRAGLRKAYYPPPLGANQPAHQWSFLRPWATITTNEPYETGTITVADGVVTGSGTTFPTWATNGWLVYSGKYYEVATRGGATSLTLVDTSSDNDASAGTEYQLIQYRVDLPTDFESLAGPMFWHNDQSQNNIPLERYPDIKLMRLYQDSDNETMVDEPRLFAIYPKVHTATAKQTWQAIFWPAFDDVYHLKYRYNVQMSDLDGTDLYPPGGAQHSEMILEACLSEAELKYNDSPGPHQEKFMALLASSIQLDRQISEAETYGVVPVNHPTRTYRTTVATNTDFVIHDGYTLADYEVS